MAQTKKIWTRVKQRYRKEWSLERLRFPLKQHGKDKTRRG